MLRKMIGVDIGSLCIEERFHDEGTQQGSGCVVHLGEQLVKEERNRERWGRVIKND